MGLSPLDENRKPRLPIERLRDIIMRPSRSVPSEAVDIARQRALAESKASSG